MPIINLDDIKEYDREQAQRQAAQKVNAEWRMRERQKKQNDAFIWSPENVAKIIRLNDKLWALMQDADRIGKSIHEDIHLLRSLSLRLLAVIFFNIIKIYDGQNRFLPRQMAI